MHPHWTLLCSLLNGTILCSASNSTILTWRMQAKRRKDTIQSLAGKTRAPKIVNHAIAAQIALPPVKKTSRSPSFLENVSFSTNQGIKLLFDSTKPTCSIFLSCQANPNRTEYLFSFFLGKLKSKKRSTSPPDMACGNLGGAAIVTAATSNLQ